MNNFRISVQLPSAEVRLLEITARELAGRLLPGPLNLLALTADAAPVGPPHGHGITRGQPRDRTLNCTKLALTTWLPLSVRWSTACTRWVAVLSRSWGP